MESSSYNDEVNKTLEEQLLYLEEFRNGIINTTQKMFIDSGTIKNYRITSGKLKAKPVNDNTTNYKVFIYFLIIDTTQTSYYRSTYIQRKLPSYFKENYRITKESTKKMGNFQLSQNEQKLRSSCILLTL